MYNQVQTFGSDEITLRRLTPNDKVDRVAICLQLRGLRLFVITMSNTRIQTRLLLLLLVSLYVIVVIRNAWVGDDGYIT